jgi:hypothetical protein
MIGEYHEGYGSEVLKIIKHDTAMIFATSDFQSDV